MAARPATSTPRPWPSPATSAPPPDEARALEGIGRSHLQDGHNSQATACLRQALAIYQRIGAPAALRVQHTLRDQNARQDSLTPAPER
jgi:hypothetical protein